MPATLQKPTPNQKVDPNYQSLVKCTYYEQRFLLTWDDKEWNSVKDWTRVAGQAVRKTHLRHTDEILPLPATTKVDIYGGKKPPPASEETGRKRGPHNLALSFAVCTGCAGKRSVLTSTI